MLCKATKKNGIPCHYEALPGEEYCGFHLRVPDSVKDTLHQLESKIYSLEEIINIHWKKKWEGHSVSFIIGVASSIVATLIIAFVVGIWKLFRSIRGHKRRSILLFVLLLIILFFVFSSKTMSSLAFLLDAISKFVRLIAPAIYVLLIIVSLLTWLLLKVLIEKHVLSFSANFKAVFLITILGVSIILCEFYLLVKLEEFLGYDIVRQFINTWYMNSTH
jgi:hypothetical protein